MPLLSICIPTYYNLGALDSNLDFLCDQSSYSIEIIICDDCPTNEVYLIIERYQSRIPIKYFRGKNEGLDSALIELIKYSTGDYVWWLGDDILLPKSIEKVCNSLSQFDNLIFLWVNSHSINDNKLTFGEIENAYFNDRNRLLEYDIGLLGFITATIFRRETALPCIENAKTHIGSSFTCLYIILYVLSMKGRIGILGQSCFTSREKPSGEVRWYDQLQVFGINLYDIVNEFDNVFEKSERRRSLSRNLVRVLKSIVVERAMGLKTGFASPSVGIKDLLVKYYKFPKFWIFLPILIIPKSIVGLIYKIYILLRTK